VYEYMQNGSLGDLLHGPKSSTLSWDIRYKIAVGAAKVHIPAHSLSVSNIEISIFRFPFSNSVLESFMYFKNVA
jgi:hypothetical protein